MSALDTNLLILVTASYLVYLWYKRPYKVSVDTVLNIIPGEYSYNGIPLHTACSDKPGSKRLNVTAIGYNLTLNKWQNCGKVKSITVFPVEHRMVIKTSTRTYHLKEIK